MLFLLPWFAFAAPTPVPGTSVTLDPPPDFVASSRFPGFGNGVDASIMVTEISEAVETMKTGFTIEALAAKGMVELERESIDDALFIHVRQALGDDDFEKWIRIAGNAKRTVLVVATTPWGDARLDRLYQSLETVVIDDPNATRSWIHIEPVAPYVEVGTFSNMQLYAPDGIRPPLPTHTPRFMVGPSIAAMDLSDMERFARTRIRQLGLEIVTESVSKVFEVDGHPAIEVHAFGKGSGLKKHLYQLILAQPDGHYVIALGLAKKKKDLPAFQRMAKSLTLSTPAP